MGAHVLNGAEGMRVLCGPARVTKSERNDVILQASE
jgi:hypothetical protein